MRETDGMEAPSNDPAAHRIVNRYMLEASAEDREQALLSLKRLARVLIRIEDRHARAWYAQRIRDSGAAAVESEMQHSKSL